MLSEALKGCAAEIDAQLDAVLGAYEPLPVVQAMRHACTGGKRLRGFFVMQSAALYGVEPARAIWPATAIEVMHAYSLVHDDLPCMDDDDLRRGAPTVHVKWDEATAVLAGDALQSLAFELTTHPDIGTGALRAQLASALARAAGAAGMVLGQALDMAADAATEPFDLQQIEALQRGKTGALFEWSACAGAHMAGAQAAPLRGFARDFGLLFQIVDDILDVIGDEEKMGKAVGKDGEAGKATFVSLLGLEAAKSWAEALSASAIAHLDAFGPEADLLRESARFALARER